MLTNRLQSKLPVSEKMQLQIISAMQGMKIDPSNLHASKRVLEQFDTLREEMLVYFSLDKFIKEKHEER